MKFTLSWLKNYLQTDATPDEIAAQLTSLGLVVDALTNPADDLKDFKIAQILSAEPHPNADKLKVCKVDTGTEILPIVCGAPNAVAGLKTVLAKVGTTIPTTGVVLKQTKIRGVESCGMLCSSAELGLDADAGGIMELENSAPVGQDYVSYAGLDDPIFDIEITPNRGDCLGIIGIARDLSATGIGQFKPIDVVPIKTRTPCSKQVFIELNPENQKACPHFMGREIRGVRNGPSPLWLQRKLQAVGLKSISALVDITNYMAFALCRPMHVFDLDTLHGHLTVRKAKVGEKIVALDEREYSLDANITVIADEREVHSIAGILGGYKSRCTDATTNVFLESAFFDPVHTALAGRSLGILSDARHRFERGVDPSLVEIGLDIATQMIIDICGGVPSEVTQAGQYDEERHGIESSIIFDPKSVKSLGGISVSREKILKILRALGFVVIDQGSHFNVSIPPWRFDIQGPADFVEEVCRVVGYDHILEEALPTPKSEEYFESKPGLVQSRKRRDGARKVLASRGLSESQTWSFVDRKKAELFGTIDPALIIMNPISQDLEIMRPSLLANLVAGVGRNHDRGLANSALFEVGSVYDSSFNDRQEMRIAGVRSGLYTKRHWMVDDRKVDVFDVKADLWAVLKSCGMQVDKLKIIPEGPKYYHPGRVGTVMLGPKTVLGTFGELHPGVLHAMAVEGPVSGFELFLDRVPVLKESTQKKALKLSNLQPLHRDFAFIVDHDVMAEQIIRAAQKVDQQLITAVAIFDVYQGPGIPQGKKSVAFTTTFEPYEKTLTDDEINHLMDQIIIAVSQETGGELRT